MARTLQKEISKFFHIDDVDIDIEVIETTRINVLDYIDNLVEMINENNKLGNDARYYYDTSDMNAVIMYKDGSIEFINENDYDGHKIKRINIESMLYEDGWVSYVFGRYEVNDAGVVTIG